MCQIVSSNRSDVEDISTSLPARRIMRRPHFVGNSKDILLCPVMGKLALPPDQFEKKRRAGPSAPPPVPSLAKEEKHSCLICSHFVEDASAGSSPSPTNSEVTFVSVFQYVHLLTILNLINLKFRPEWLKFTSFHFLRQGTSPINPAGSFPHHVCSHSLGYDFLSG